MSDYANQTDGTQLSRYFCILHLKNLIVDIPSAIKPTELNR